MPTVAYIAAVQPIKRMNMKFNKTLSSKQCGKNPTVIFRRLTGDRDRYQGLINTSGVKLIESLNGAFIGLKIVFSDEHSFIGFKPLHEDKGVSKVFGATELFSSLPLVIGKHYTLKLSDGIAVIDSAEFK